MAFIAHLDKSLILLVGRDGNGKTSCKKSIERVSNVIEVVDFSGLGDTGSDRSDNILTVTNNIERVTEMTDLKGGFKALVFVMKYGIRFTKQEKDAVEDVKTMFGEDVFQKHGIILMSYGDLLEVFNAEDEGDFIGWCREQSGIIVMCVAETPGKRGKQCDEWITMVTGISKSYELNEFYAAQKRLQKPIRIRQDIPPSDNKSNTFKSGLAYKLFWLCLLLAVVFGTAFTISVVKLITWLIVACIALKLKN